MLSFAIQATHCIIFLIVVIYSIDLVWNMLLFWVVYCTRLLLFGRGSCYTNHILWAATKDSCCQRFWYRNALVHAWFIECVLRVANGGEATPPLLCIHLLGSTKRCRMAVLRLTVAASHLVGEVGLRLDTCRLLALEHHVFKVHLLRGLLIRLHATNMSTNQQIVATFTIALFRCFIAIGGLTQVWRIGRDHVVLIDGELLLVWSWVARRPGLARPVIIVDSNHVAY